MFKGKFKHTSTKKLLTQINITFSTKEEVDELELMQIENMPGYLIFSTDELKKGVEDAMKDVSLGVDDGKMSPSKKLRGVLYEYWYKHQQSKGVQWEDFYKNKMSGIIKMIEEKL